MNVTKVLGIGSPFGDDQAGWKVAETLKQRLSMHANISSFVLIESHDRPGARLIELMSGFRTVFIIDAVNSGSRIGTIHRFKKDNIIDSENRFSTHGISVLQALYLASALNELPDNILFYGIEIDTITMDSTLSQRVENAIEELAIQLKNEIVNAYAL